MVFNIIHIQCFLYVSIKLEYKSFQTYECSVSLAQYNKQKLSTQNEMFIFDFHQLHFKAGHAKLYSCV